ncbi:MAG TPA: DUF3309 family protein [Mycobacterium sp.]|jgi:hypothetical protein
MSPLAIILIVILILVMFGGFHGYRSGWYSGGPGYYGYGFSGLGLVVIILLVLLLTGYL